MMGPSAPAAGVSPFLERDSFDLAMEVKLDLGFELEDICSSNAGSCLRTRQNSLIFLKETNLVKSQLLFGRILAVTYPKD